MLGLLKKSFLHQIRNTANITKNIKIKVLLKTVDLVLFNNNTKRIIEGITNCIDKITKGFSVPKPLVAKAT